MQKIQMGFLSLCLLTTLACQPVSQIAQAPAKLTQADYSRQVSSLFKDYNKANFEGVSSSSIALSVAAGLSSSGAPTSNSASLTVSPALTSARAPSSSSTNNPNPETQKILDALMKGSIEQQKKSLQASLKAIKSINNRLAALVPPPELAAKHTSLVAFFNLNNQLSEKMEAQVDFSSYAAFEKSMEAFRKNNQSEFDALSKQAPQVMETLADLTLEVYRAESLSKQQGPALDAASYKEKVKRLFGNNNLNSPTQLLFPAQGASRPPSEAPASDYKGQLEKMKTQFQALLQEFAALHPPAEYQEAHLALYASLNLGFSLQTRILTLVMAKVGDNPEAIKNNPTLLMTELLSNSDLLLELVSFFPLMNRLQKIMQDLK